MRNDQLAGAYFADAAIILDEARFSLEKNSSTKRMQKEAITGAKWVIMLH